MATKSPSGTTLPPAIERTVALMGQDVAMLATELARAAALRAQRG
jgi:hypothetical protein